MRLVVISDTHGRHEDLGVLEGDVLIHCGDFCDVSGSTEVDVENVDAWFAQQRFQAIVCIGGNHDFGALMRVECQEPVFQNAVWLLDEAYTFGGVKFYGSPWVPQLMGWAFYLSDEELQQKWSMIPEETDVLITHTPPHGILDEPRSSRVHGGCPHLRDRVRVVRPTYHLFGHEHASAGTERHGDTTFINASSANSSLEVVHPPVVLDL
jgi:Icc-related predicted phosphoesterase